MSEKSCVGLLGSMNFREQLQLLTLFMVGLVVIGLVYFSKIESRFQYDYGCTPYPNNTETDANAKTRINVIATKIEQTMDVCVYFRNNVTNTTETTPDNTTDAEVLHIAHKGCKHLRNHYIFPPSDVYPTKEERGYPIAYSILMHKNLNQVLQLLSAIYAQQNIYCIHLDLKASDILLQALQTTLKCFPNVFLSSKRENVVYASFSRLQADINCMNDLVKLPTSVYNWTHLINLCGQVSNCYKCNLYACKSRLIIEACSGVLILIIY